MIYLKLIYFLFNAFLAGIVYESLRRDEVFGKENLLILFAVFFLGSPIVVIGYIYDYIVNAINVYKEK